MIRRTRFFFSFFKEKSNLLSTLESFSLFYHFLRSSFFSYSFFLSFFLFFFVFVVSTPGSRYYADVAGIRVPILSSVSLTSESSASVRSSKGKLQLGDVSPIERTQTNRTRIVIERSNVGGVQHLPSSTIRTLSSSPLFVEEDRPVFVSLYQRIEF